MVLKAMDGLAAVTNRKRASLQNRNDTRERHAKQEYGSRLDFVTFFIAATTSHNRGRPMDTENQDRNLLVAVIALQMDYITQNQMVEAMKDWVFDNSKAMEAILERRQFLKSEHADFLKAIVHQHLNIHQNDISASLVALSTFSSTEKQLDGLDDQLDVTLQAISQNRSIQFAAATDSISFDSNASDLSISNRFRILKSHARGGLGEVSIATDTELNREVAIKQIQQPFDGQAESRQCSQCRTAPEPGRLPASPKLTG